MGPGRAGRPPAAGRAGRSGAGRSRAPDSQKDSMLSFCFGGTLVTSCAARLSVAWDRRVRRQGNSAAAASPVSGLPAWQWHGSAGACMCSGPHCGAGHEARAAAEPASWERSVRMPTAPAARPPPLAAPGPRRAGAPRAPRTRRCACGSTGGTRRTPPSPTRGTPRARSGATGTCARARARAQLVPRHRRQPCGAGVRPAGARPYHTLPFFPGRSARRRPRARSRARRAREPLLAAR
jgi:hypothetical protein